MAWVAMQAPVLAEDFWTGLWRVNRFYEGKLDGTYHFFVTRSAAGEYTVTAYTDDARPMIQQSLQVTDTKLELKVAHSVKQPLPLLFELSREGDQTSGKWTFAQMQLLQPVTGEAAGFRVTNSPDWQPWPFLSELVDKEQDWLDLAGLLLEKAPRGDFESFLSFWDQLEPRYYFLIQSSLYGDSRKRERREEVLRAMFEGLASSKERRKLLKQFPAIAGRVSRLAQTQGSAAKSYLVNWPLPPHSTALHPLALWTRIPTPEEEAACACVLDLRERFLLTDGWSFGEGAEEAAARWEERLLREVLWPHEAPSIAVEVFRQGLVHFLTQQAHGQEAAPVEADQQPALAARVRESLLTPLPASAEVQQQQVEPLIGLASGFARYLIAKHTLPVVLRRIDRDIIQDWQEYLESLG